MQNVRLYGAVALVSMAFAGSTAMAAESGKSSFDVRVTVPEYCEVNASTLMASEGNGFASGSIFESCNTQEGFQVIASHRPLEANEAVAFNYAGSLTYLRDDGWSQVANRTGAKFGMKPISIRYSALTTPLAINLTITTL
ncbi:Putative secreted protein [Sphingopyxis fribergensis]|uniref:Putative secreted protein n=2 Tax=Sphingopyxis fribergensis TaxID=1515612 RepID=A0A0A7PEM9_9SPHN|nr:Putative secreted protein [Sphingopyxis fribergensis]